jgi:Holliday junction resolvasome RuvABC DNA-binding subunit
MSQKTLIKRLLRKNGVGSKLNSPHLSTALQVDQSAFVDNNKIKYVDNGDREVLVRLPGETKQSY